MIGPNFMALRHSHLQLLRTVTSLVLLGSSVVGLCPAQDPSAPPEASPTGDAPAQRPTIGNLFIREYRVSGSKLLDAATVGDTVYPFLGPNRTTDDIEEARATLEKAYHDKGFQTVMVTVPQQSGRRGIIRFVVVEAKVRHLNVNGSRWFLPSEIRKRAPSLAPGVTPNFEDVQRDVIALNRSADLRVTPRLSPTADPAVLDIELDVEDTLPLHGSIELNNRYSENTVPLRLNGALSYGNLWQLGHTLGFSFQIAPERLQDAEIYSAYYMLPVTDRTSLLFTGITQNSDVSTLGGVAVAGRGKIFGARANIVLPQGKQYYHSLSVGLDYKHFDEDVTLADAAISSPIDYYPFSLSYGGSWNADHSFTEINGSFNWHFRGMGSDPVRFDNKRYLADGSYMYFRGDITHTHDLPAGIQVMAKVSGQAANNPLINSEQLAAGGQSSVRGYLESAALGDNGVFGTLELRSPSFLGKHSKDADTKDKQHEWRVYGFLEGGRLSLNKPLPEQQDIFELGSAGIGTRLKLWNHLNGSLDASFPLVTLGNTLADDLFLSFRVWAEF